MSGVGLLLAPERKYTAADGAVGVAPLLAVMRPLTQQLAYADATIDGETGDPTAIAESCVRE